MQSIISFIVSRSGRKSKSSNSSSSNKQQQHAASEERPLLSQSAATSSDSTSSSSSNISPQLSYGWNTKRREKVDKDDENMVVDTDWLGGWSQSR
ncbi:GD14068 [Drosophila simulans]|uniref:GD14068 n=1 Tax=Drosophila simulans TaxID=7240 RepID=B4QLK7_DROSI|nr:GD14068 [Drosophila simulans]